MRQPYRESAELVQAIREIYEHPYDLWDLDLWDLYEACEELVDVEDNFPFWRFRHLRTVTRTIGTKPGTGGSAGVDVLRRALSLPFFPELYTVRSVIGR